jgi:hypothetical protein
MKVLLVFAVAVIAALAFGPQFSGMVRGLRGGAKAEHTQFAGDAARKFNAKIKQVLPGGKAFATGGFYDVPPSETVTPERLDYRDQRLVSVKEFYIEGMPPDVIDGQEWRGWLVRTGAKTYTSKEGTYRTVPALRLVADPPPPPPGSGAWMKHHGRTALDSHPRH